MVPSSSEAMTRSGDPAGESGQAACDRLTATRTRRVRTVIAGSARLAVAMAVAVAAFLSGAHVQKAAAQDKKTVVVLDIQGAPKNVQQGIAKALKNNYIVLQTNKWNDAAKRLGATGQKTDEIALVAGDLKVDAVVTGKLKQDDTGGYALNIGTRHGPSGKLVGKLKYELKSQKVDPVTMTQIETDIGPSVEQAIAGPPPETPAIPEPKTDPNAPPPGSREEDPFAQMKKEQDKANAERTARPSWYPFFDANAGFILNGRNLSFTEEAGTSVAKCYDFDQRVVDPNDPTSTRQVNKYYAAKKQCGGFLTSATGGVRVDVTGFPLAMLPYNGLRGLGIGATFDYMFWPPSRAENTATELSTQEFRLEVGLRYHWNILGKRSRPSLLANVQYGLHSFSIQKQEKMYTYQFEDDKFMTQTRTVKGVNDNGLPDILYQYVTIGLGGRVPYYATDKLYFGLLLNFNFHIMLGYGEMGTGFANPMDVFNAEAASKGAYGPAGGFGPASGYGLRVAFTPLEMIPWKGLTIRLSGFFEQFRTNFTNGSAGNTGLTLPPVDRTDENASRHIAQGATDTYFGGTVQIGYQF